MVRERDPNRTSSKEGSSAPKTDRQPLANISAKMQSPPTNQSQQQSSSESRDAQKIKAPAQAEFGQASPLRNPMQAQNPMYNPLRGPPKQQPPNPFVQRRQAPQGSAHARPSSTLHAQPTSSRAISDIPAEQRGFYYPGQAPPRTGAPQSDPALARLQSEMIRPYRTTFEIPTPANPPTFTTQPAPRPTFSSLAPPSSYKPAFAPRSTVDLTRKPDEDEDDDQFDPDAAIRSGSAKFGAVDPYMYLDSERANENIKNLLEGAFDDENEKRNTRLKKRAKKAKKDQDDQEAKSLADKLSALAVKTDEKPQAIAKAHPLAEEEEEEDDGTVEGLTVRLLPHQVEGVSWMIDKESGVRKNGVLPHGGILADDMGLGKTVQSVALILLNSRPPPDAKKEYPKQKLPGKQVDRGTLVVAPLALIKQWEGEIKSKVTRSHALKVLVHHGPSRTKSAAELKKYDVVITTYQILASEHVGSDMTRSDGPRIGCFGVHWYRLILDEAHSIKNRNAKSTLACCALNSWNRWCLTGTPMQNNLDELQSLIKFLRIKPYCDLPSWKDQITQPMKSGRGGLAMARLRHYLSAFMKRRTKDILKKDGALNFGGKANKEGEEKREGMQIVKREVMTVECGFDEEEQQFYDRLQDRAQRRINDMMDAGGKTDYIGALVLLLRLRQACDHPYLIEGAINKDRDAMTTGSAPAMGVSQTPRKSSKVEDDDMDDLAKLMGGVTVQSRNCDICQFGLSDQRAREGKSRCQDCESDLLQLRGGNKKDRDQRKKPKPLSHAVPRRNRRVLVDSDDEDAEGGGRSLGSVDSATDEESDEDNESSSAEDASDDDGQVLAGLAPFNRSKQKPSTKVRHILRILHSETPKHKTIIFSQFTSMLDLIQPHLKQRFARYDGSMRPDAREAALNALRTDPKTRVLLCSLKCGSLGLNLTAASRVVIVEPFWNPFVEEQAIDRVHRLNQTVDVKVFRLTIRGSVEERILALQERKRELAAAALEGGAAVGKLSMTDILGLFKGDAQTAALHAEDRRFEEKFGGDARLIDGPNGSGSGSQQQKKDAAVTDPRRKEGKGRVGTEHQVYGRRW